MLTYETGSTKVGKTDSWQCNSLLCSSRSNIGTDRPKQSRGLMPRLRPKEGCGCPPTPPRRRAPRPGGPDGRTSGFTRSGTWSGREMEIRQHRQKSAWQKWFTRSISRKKTPNNQNKNRGLMSKIYYLFSIRMHLSHFLIKNE